MLPHTATDPAGVLCLPPATVDAPASSAAACLTKWREASPDAAQVSISFRGPNGAVGNRNQGTHLVHWFPAKMFYRIPIDILNTIEPDPKSIILDPFCGSGTVLVEAQARGHRAVGLDINPLACTISRVKTKPLDEFYLERTLSTIVERAASLRCEPTDDCLSSFWFREPARNILYRLFRAIDETTQDDSYRDFFIVTLSSIVRSCSMADPYIPPPVRMRKAKIEIAGDRYASAYESAMALDGASILAKYAAAARKNIRRVSSLAGDAPRVNVLRRSALKTKLPSQSIDVVITSPPYCGAQKYVRTFKLELGLIWESQSAISTLDRRTLGTERVPAKASGYHHTLLPKHQAVVRNISKMNPHRGRMLGRYFLGLNQFARELARVLKPSGNAFVTFGTSTFCGIPIDFAECFKDIAQQRGLHEVLRLTDNIPSRGMITKRHRSAAVIPEENVLWLTH